jgi:hypothetical protein
MRATAVHASMVLSAKLFMRAASSTRQLERSTSLRGWWTSSARLYMRVAIVHANGRVGEIVREVRMQCEVAINYLDSVPTKLSMRAACTYSCL